MTLFSPPLLLRNGHTQSILNSAGPRRWLMDKQRCALAAQQEFQLLDCGDGVRLIGAFNKSRRATDSLVIVLHGWEGCYTSTYVVSATATLLNAGFDVFRLNLRDHGPSLHLNRGLFNATLTPEVTAAIRRIQQLYPARRTLLAGYSMGGNFALRIAADSGTALNLAATVAISPPLVPAHTMAILERRLSIYQHYFFSKWKKSLATKLYYFPDLAYGPLLARCRNLHDINQFFIPHHTPYQTRADYFASYALTGQRLAHLSCPAWLITSADDPLVPAADLSAIQPPNTLTIERTDNGGHCGFLRNLRLDSWVEQRLVEIFSEMPG